MTNRIISIYLLFLTTNSFGQTIQDFEHDLSWYSSSEQYGDKIQQARKLQEIDPFNHKATEYICRYYSNRKIDSVSNYFDSLIAKFPGATEPYLLRSEFLSFEVDYREKDVYNKRSVQYLMQGLNINPKDPLIVFKLAELYYRDFIFPWQKEQTFGFSLESEEKLYDSSLAAKIKTAKRSTFEHAADSSLKYYYQLWELSSDKREIIYFPTRQIECFLNQSKQSPIPKEFEKKLDQCYFPSSYFTNLSQEWECDFKNDYLFEIESGKRTADWLKVQLTDLKEECLFNKEIPSNSTVYRFTWLRSFHHPIAVRIENVENKIMLYWKVGNGAGGYEPKGLKKSGRKKLSLEAWIEFERLIRNSTFESLPNEKYIPMNDGATWTLERKRTGSFKAHNTNSPVKIREACLYLLDLTNIKVKDHDRY